MIFENIFENDCTLTSKNTNRLTVVSKKDFSQTLWDEPQALAQKASRKTFSDSLPAVEVFVASQGTAKPFLHKTLMDNVSKIISHHKNHQVHRRNKKKKGLRNKNLLPFSRALKEIWLTLLCLASESFPRFVLRPSLTVFETPGMMCCDSLSFSCSVTQTQTERFGASQDHFLISHQRKKCRATHSAIRWWWCVESTANTWHVAITFLMCLMITKKSFYDHPKRAIVVSDKARDAQVCGSQRRRFFFSLPSHKSIK